MYPFFFLEELMGGKSSKKIYYIYKTVNKYQVGTTSAFIKDWVVRIVQVEVFEWR